MNDSGWGGHGRGASGFGPGVGTPPWGGTQYDNIMFAIEDLSLALTNSTYGLHILREREDVIEGKLDGLVIPTPPDVGDIAAGVWEAAIGTDANGTPSLDVTAGGVLRVLAFLFTQGRNWQLFRYSQIPHFLFEWNEPMYGNIPPFPKSSELEAVDMDDQGATETDFDFLTRVCPSYDWYGGVTPGTVWAEVGPQNIYARNPIAGYVLFAPLWGGQHHHGGLTLEDVEYTPSSGPPKRNSLTDALVLLMATSAILGWTDG